MLSEKLLLRPPIRKTWPISNDTLLEPGEKGERLRGREYRCEEALAFLRARAVLSWSAQLGVLSSDQDEDPLDARAEGELVKTIPTRAASAIKNSTRE